MAAERARLAAPVVSIGNIAMGGRGKTPLAIHVARLFVDAGERPAILSRGYKRRNSQPGVVVVSDGRRVLAGLDDSGDEPLLMAEAVPGAAVLVCAVRAEAGALAERQLGATVHVLDDGFQHRSLERDVDIVIVREEDLAGRRMPFGLLRSSVSSLDRASAVVFDGPPAEATGGRHFAHTFTMTRTLGEPFAIDPRAPLPPSDGPVLAVAGIAEPNRFAAALAAAGWQVAGRVGFRDHHPYSARDVARLVEAARGHGAGMILTTAKDAIKLRAYAPLPFPFAVVPLAVAVEPAAAFRDWLLGELARARGERP